MYVILVREKHDSSLFMPAGILYRSREIAEAVAKSMEDLYWELQVHELTFISYVNKNVHLH